MSSFSPEELMYQQLVALRNRHADLEYATWRTITALEKLLVEDDLTKLKAQVEAALLCLLDTVPADRKGMSAAPKAKPLAL